MKNGWLWAVALPLIGCGAVERSYVRKDFEQVDRTQTIRLAVVTAPYPDQSETLGQMWSLIAQRYVNDHRDYIAREAKTSQTVSKELCGEKIEAILRLTPHIHRYGEGVEGKLYASLYRCKDGALIWSAEAEDDFASEDPLLREVTERYVEKFGEEVRPYVAPSFRLIKETLETLPKPSIRDNDEAQTEKIEDTE